MEAEREHHILRESSLLTRAANFVLFSATEFVSLSEIRSALPESSLHTADLEVLICADSRFTIREEELDTLVGLDEITREDIALKDIVNKWRDAMCRYLGYANLPLCSLATALPRPPLVDKSIKLIDVLRCDSRFVVHGPGNNVMVSVRRSLEEQEVIKDTWRDDIYAYIKLHMRRFSVSQIGADVPRPAGLLKPTSKLLDVINSDPLQRFDFKFDRKDISHVGIKLNSEDLFQLCEEWRTQIAHYMFTNNAMSLSLSVIGTSVHRPSLLGSTKTLQEILIEDPLHRFKLTGLGLEIRALLVKRKYFAAPAGCVLSDNVETVASHVGSTDSDSNSIASNENWKIVGSRQHTNSTGVVIAAVPIATASVFGGMPKKWSPASMGSKSVAWSTSTMPRDDNRNVTRDVPLKSFLNMTAGNIQENSTFAPPPGFDMTVPSSSPPSWRGFNDDVDGDDYLSSLSSLLDSSRTNGSIGEVANTGSDHICALSAVPQTDTLDLLKVASHQPQAVDVKLLSLDIWLPEVYCGFPPELVRSFVKQFSEEGYICANDLIVANSLNELSFEYLKEEFEGFKKGHFNRLMSSLAEMVVNKK